MLEYIVLSKLHKIITLLICYEALYMKNTQTQQKQDIPTHTVYLARKLLLQQLLWRWGSSGVDTPLWLPLCPSRRHTLSPTLLRY